AGDAGADGGWVQAWEAALTALELDVAQAEAALAADHLEPVPVERWAPPQLDGPLPFALLDRARALHERQVEVARRLGEAARLSRRHQRAAEAMRAGGAAVPVYVDVAG